MMTEEPPERGMGPGETGAYLLLLLLMPAVPVLSPGGGAALLSSVWLGIFGTNAFALKVGRGRFQTYANCFLVFMAMTGLSHVRLVVFGSATIMGMLFHASREGASPSSAISIALRKGLSGLVILQICAGVYPLLPLSGSPGLFELLAAAFALLALASVLEGTIIRLVSAEFHRPTSSALRRFVAVWLFPLTGMPFLLPAMASMQSGGGATYAASPDWPVLTFIMGNVALLASQLTALVLVRSISAHDSKLRAEQLLAELSMDLAASESALEMLGHLASKWSGTAHPAALRAKWRDICYALPAGEPPGRRPEVVSRGRNGLVVEIWEREEATTDRTRLDAFLSHTDAALRNIGMRDKVSEDIWKCMEAVVHSLDLTDRRTAGHSRRVAAVATAIGKQLKLQQRSLENLRMAALLHHASHLLSDQGSGPDGDETDDLFTGELRDMKMVELPAEVRLSIHHMTENYDGTGRPDGLPGNAIPLGSRILAVANGFVTAAEQGSSERAIREVDLRSGTLFDPAIVSALAKAYEKGIPE